MISFTIGIVIGAFIVGSIWFIHEITRDMRSPPLTVTSGR